MPETELEADVGITKNLGNYESLRLGARKKVTLKPGDDEEKAWNDLWSDVQSQIENQLREAAKVIG
jgi:hypothetical protein